MAKGKKTGGRVKGTPNKVTGDVRAMVLAALDAAGGVEYLTQQAHENPAPFLALVGRTLPKDINLSAEVKHTLVDMIGASYAQHERATTIDVIPEGERAH